MLQQHGKLFDKAMEAGRPVMDYSAKMEFEKEKKTGADAARQMANMFRNKLIESKGSAQIVAARDLFRYVNGELKDEQPKFIETFLSTLDGKTEAGSQSAVYNSLTSAQMDQKRAGIFMIVCIADHQSGGITRYTNYLLKMLNVYEMDEETVKMACRALAYLIMTSKSYAADLVDRCLDYCQEWLQMQDQNIDPRERIMALDDNRRLAAAHLSRELAIFTPTAFFLRANLFFKFIFNALKDKNPIIRNAAIEALHSVLTITSQREAKQKTEWYKECFDEAFKTQDSNTPRDEYDRFHAVAIVLNELLRISDSTYEHVRMESSQFEKQSVTSDDPIDWIVFSRNSETVESATARQLVKEKFREITKCVCRIIEVTQQHKIPALSTISSTTSTTGSSANVLPVGTSITTTSSSSLKLQYLNSILMQLLPRICSFPQCEPKFHSKAFDTAYTILSKNSVAAPAIGMMMLANPQLHKHQITKVMGFISTAIKKLQSDGGTDNLYTLLFLFVDAYHEEVEEQIKSILPSLLDIPLSRGLTNVLKMIMMRIPKLRLNVQDGVMASVYFNLTGVTIPSKSEPAARPPAPRTILQKASVDPAYLERVVLSIETLGEFYFSRGALQRIMQYVADYYFVAENNKIRHAAVKCCCDMIQPFVSVYKEVTSDKRQHLLTTIQGVLRSLVSVIVVDPHVEVRMQVIRCFSEMSREFLVHLAQPEMLEVQFMALHDEKLEMQLACVTLLGRLAELNPALVFPRMRRMLLETLSQLTNSGQTRLEQHSAKMIGQIARQSPKFLRPYIGSLLIALLPKIRSELKYADVTTQVLNAISEISVIGGAELVQAIDPLFSKLTHLINDSSHLQRREASLRAIGQICRSTAYVVDPYRNYPSLLDDLLRLLKTVMSSTMRREAIKTLGILGAIDPYTHKVFTGSVQSAFAISTALSLPMTQGDVTDPRQDIIQWFNYEKCTLEEFYPAITVANLMLMMQDEDIQSYPEIAQAIVTIFRSLGKACGQYIEQVVPRLIEVCRSMNNRTNRAGLREFFLRQLSMFVAIIKSHATPYMTDIFAIIAEAWKEDISVKMCVVSVLEEMGTALGVEFSTYTGELIPYLLYVLQNDKTKERSLAVRVLESMRPLCPCLVSHLHLVLPPVLIILDDYSISLPIRMTALDTILHMAINVDIAAYAPRMMQSWHHCISTQELREKLFVLLIEIIKQLGKHFDVFKRSVDIKLRDHGLDRHPLHDVYQKLSQRAQMSRDAISSNILTLNQANLQATQAVIKGETEATETIVLGSGGVSERMKNSIETGSPTVNTDECDEIKIEKNKKRIPSSARSTREIMVVPITKQRLNRESLSMSWKVDALSSKEEWLQWLYKLRMAFLKNGSSPSLRAASSLGDQHPHLARDLFPAAFMSIWTELDSHVQDELARSLRKALKTGYSDVIQSILNLAEFMDHSEKGPLPIEYEVLGKCAEKTKAFAKASRYKELQILKRWDDYGETKLTMEDCQALIMFANKLNVQEEAAGVVRYAERNKMDIKMRGRWYEKLNEWEKALEYYQREKKHEEDTTMHEMRCLEALAQWDHLNQKAQAVKESSNRPLDHKVAVIAARGAWAVDNWERMSEYVSHISENTQDGAMLRAVVAFHNQDYQKAEGLIEKVRDMFDSELTAMASESYERAYAPMVFVQQMAELEEAIQFKLRPELRPRIALLWSRRLQGCRENVEQWQRLLMLRSLVLSPQEMYPLRVKFASLCRKQGKSSMSRAVLRELLNLSPDSNLLEADVEREKPQLVMALCKQLWQEGHRDAAISRLEGMTRHLEKLHKTAAEQNDLYRSSAEVSRICSKVYLKLGEWTDIKNKALRKAAMSSLSEFVQEQVSPQRDTINGYRSHDEHDKTVAYYVTATQYDPKWHKAWHKLGIAYFSRIKDRKGAGSKKKLSGASMQQINHTLCNPISPRQLHDIPIPPALGSLFDIPSTAGPQPSVNMMQLSTPMSSPTNYSKYVQNAKLAIESFLNALHYTPGSRLEDTLRLLQLWFDYGEHEEVYKVLSDTITGLSITIWLEVIPQLMARLDSSDREKPVQLIMKVLSEIAKHNPQALVYAVSVATRSPDKIRKKNAIMLLEKMSDYHPKLVDEARMVTEELVRCAILWHERWHDALDEASRLYYHRSMQENNVQAMYEALKDLHSNMSAMGPATTMKEHSFNQTYQVDLREANKYCQAFERSRNVKDLNQAWEIYCQRVFKRLRDQLSSLDMLDLNYVSPNLVKAKNLQLSVPGTYDSIAPTVSIASFATKLTVISSKQRPRKMIILGSNGLKYQFLLKGHEDPRQDERVMQLFGLINTLLANNSDTCRRNLTIQRYSIVALSKDCGLIGWVPECDTLHSLVKEYREKKVKISLSTEHKALQKMSAETEHLTLMQKMQVFECALRTTKGDDLRQILWLKSPSSEVWFDRRTNYTRSMACMSMIGYILGLGDRHPSNLMIDRLTGKIVHIDFGDCFEVAMLREKFPEKVPFRLTRMLINAMEVTGLEGVYKYTAERVMKVLRLNEESLLAVLEAFVYDPVINWRLVEGMKRNPKIPKDPARMNTNQMPSISTTEVTMDTIKRKLAGTEFSNIPIDQNPDPIPISEQLERLIAQATNHFNLCQSYIGWCPFW